MGEKSGVCDLRTEERLQVAAARRPIAIASPSSSPKLRGEDRGNAGGLVRTESWVASDRFAAAEFVKVLGQCLPHPAGARESAALVFFLHTPAAPILFLSRRGHRLLDLPSRTPTLAAGPPASCRLVLSFYSHMI